MACRLVGYPPRHKEEKKAPGVPGLLGSIEETPRYYPKAQIRQGADSPDRRSHRRVGTCHNALLRGVKPQAVTTVCSNRCEPVRVGAPRLPGLHARLTHRELRGRANQIGRALIPSP
jgi:hypothetical protein